MSEYPTSRVLDTEPEEVTAVSEVPRGALQSEVPPSKFQWDRGSD